MTKTDEASTGADGLGAILAPVEKDLAAVEALLREVLRPPTDRVRPLIENVKRFRGKMLRPALVLLSGRCFGDIGPPHHHLGAIVEMIHVATLVHDDVLDSADHRRGFPTVNREWGNHAAVLLGDYLFATAFALSANLENRLASRYLSWITGIVCQGEISQIRETGNLDLPEEVYFDIIEKKTAYLFSASSRVGAEYMNAPEDATTALADYGMKLGSAFQIVDDCLDLDGEESSVGKTLGTDADQGKATLPVIHYFRTAPKSDAERLRGLLGDGASDHREEIRQRLESQGSLEHARQRAASLADEAVNGLRVVPAGPPRAALEQLARYSLRRRR